MTDPDPGAVSRPITYRIVAGFGRFWWDFLVGDTPELFVGSVVVVGLVALMCIDHSLRTITAVIMPVLVAAVVVLSVWKEGRRRRS
jgi:Na+/melibiose symporter-like transporter